jgi:hypothetical protein
MFVFLNEQDELGWTGTDPNSAGTDGAREVAGVPAWLPMARWSHVTETKKRVIPDEAVQGIAAQPSLVEFRILEVSHPEAAVQRTFVDAGVFAVVGCQQSVFWIG